MSPEELDTYRAHVGRKQTEHDVVSPELVKRFAAATDQPFPGTGRPLPPMYGRVRPFRHRDADRAELGPRRRWWWCRPAWWCRATVKALRAGVSAAAQLPGKRGGCWSAKPPPRCPRSRSVDFREGKTGGLIFVRGEDRLHARRYRCASRKSRPWSTATTVRRIPPVVAEAHRTCRCQNTRPATPGTRTASRCSAISAVTYNAHRIHYDLDYVTKVEGYPTLVVHGPFTALQALHLSPPALLGGVKTFKFRGEAPLFVDQPVRLVAKKEGDALQNKAMRCDGVVGMSATAT